MINVFIILYQNLSMTFSKKKIKQQIDNFKKSFLQFSSSPFSNFFADDDIADIIEHTPHKRNSVFTPLVTLKAFIAYSGSKLPPIPDECCHPFHFKAATDSG